MSGCNTSSPNPTKSSPDGSFGSFFFSDPAGSDAFFNDTSGFVSSTDIIVSELS